MLILDKIKDKNNFSDSESKVAAYILENPNKVIEMTIHELSFETYASASTITRFCRKLEVDGFTDLKLQLAKELNTYALSDSRIAQDTPFSKLASPQEIASSIMNLNIQSILDTYNSIDIDNLLKVAKDIKAYDEINFYGRGQSLILCEEFQYKLLRIGIDSNVIIQEGFQKMKSAAQNKNSLTIMISYYGDSEHNLTILKTLKKRNMKTILITGPHQNALTPLADTVVRIPSQEKLANKMASYSSRAAMQLVIDIIYALVFSFDYDQNLEYVKVL